MKSTVQRGRALLISRSKSQMKLLSAHPSGTIWRPGCSPHASLRACVFQQWGVSQSIRRRRSVLMAHSAAWQKCFVRSQVMEADLLSPLCQPSLVLRLMSLRLHSPAASLFADSSLHFPSIPSSFSHFYEPHLHFCARICSIKNAALLIILFSMPGPPSSNQESNKCRLQMYVLVPSGGPLWKD